MTDLLKQHQLFNLLKDDKVLFQEFLNNSKECIVILNSNGIIIEWNHAAERITGISYNDAVDHNFFSLLKNILPVLRHSQEIKIPIEKIISDQISGTGNLSNKSIHVRIINENDEKKFLKTLFTHYKNKGENYLGIISKDITEELKISTKAKQTEKDLNTIFNNDIVGIAFCKPNGDFINVNPKFSDITGYSSGELKELNIADITHPDDKEQEANLCENAIKNLDTKFSIEKRYIRKDKTVIWVKLNTTIHWSKNNQIEAIIGFVEDITHRKKTDEALIESEKKYRYVTEKANDIIYTISLDSKITFYNKSIERLFDMTTEEIEKNSYHHLMLPQDKEFAKKLHADIYQGNTPPIFEHGFNLPNGKLIYLECSVSPLFDDHKNVIGALGIARDITKRRIAQDTLKESKSELEDLVRAKDKFLSVIAHDLRNPFNLLIGYSDLILGKLDKISKDDLRKYVTAINNSSNNSYNLLKNLLDWSKTESGHISFIPEILKLSIVINNVMNNLKYAAEEKSIIIHFRDENNFTVNSDENMLRTVLRNLISNAIKFSYKNSEIEIELIEEKLQFIVTIIDSGIGISEENLSKLFSQETNFSQEVTKNETGTGLGLILCKEFVTTWGGRIWVESNSKKGSSFSFSIPK